MNFHYGGMRVERVEAGTKIEQDGVTMDVTETNAVQQGNIVYVTHTMYDAIRAKCLTLPPGPSIDPSIRRDDAAVKRQT